MSNWPWWATEDGPPPFVSAPREYAGNMCGVRVPGVEPVPGGSADPSLVLSWFYDRYIPDSQAKIRATWKRQGLIDVIVSWPDSQAIGKTPQQFRAMCLDLIEAGFRPVAFLSAKPTRSADIRSIDETIANIELVAPLLVGIVPRVCFFWEGSLWLTPAEAQRIVDRFAPMFLAYGCKTYVHFQSGYFAFQPDGQDTAAYWWRNVGLLTGILHQRDFNEDRGIPAEYQARIVDCLERYAGRFNFPTDSGFGHPFDFIAVEITAELQFNLLMTKAGGDAWGRVALTTPASVGPLGPVRVMGSGNGQ